MFITVGMKGTKLYFKTTTQSKEMHEFMGARSCHYARPHRAKILPTLTRNAKWCPVECFVALLWFCFVL